MSNKDTSPNNDPSNEPIRANQEQIKAAAANPEMCATPAQRALLTEKRKTVLRNAGRIAAGCIIQVALGAAGAAVMLKLRDRNDAKAEDAAHTA